MPNTNHTTKPKPQNQTDTVAQQPQPKPPDQTQVQPIHPVSQQRPPGISQETTTKPKPTINPNPITPKAQAQPNPKPQVKPITTRPNLSKPTTPEPNLNHSPRTEIEGRPEGVGLKIGLYESLMKKKASCSKNVKLRSPSSLRLSVKTTKFKGKPPESKLSTGSNSIEKYLVLKSKAQNNIHNLTGVCVSDAGFLENKVGTKTISEAENDGDLKQRTEVKGKIK